MNLRTFIVLFAIISVLMICTSAASSSSLRDAPTGGTITISPSYFQKATEHIKSTFDQSVINSFTVSGMQSTPLTTLKPCLINYDNLLLESFNNSGISYSAIPTNSSQQTTATHQITIHQPSFKLKTFPYSAACPIMSGVGLLNTEASGSISGNWSADSITVTITETVSNISSPNNGAVLISAPTLMTKVGMELAYDYNEIEGVAEQGFIFDGFWKHHVSVTLQQAVNSNIESLFQNSGVPINLLVSNMNALFSQWTQVCAIDQKTIPGTTILNTHPLCETQTIDGLPAMDYRIVQVSNSSAQISSSAAQTQQQQQTCTPIPGTCWGSTPYPGNGNVLVKYTNCVQCTSNHGNLTGTAGTVNFLSNQ